MAISQSTKKEVLTSFKELKSNPDIVRRVCPEYLTKEERLKQTKAILLDKLSKFHFRLQLISKNNKELEVYIKEKEYSKHKHHSKATTLCVYATYVGDKFYCGIKDGKLRFFLQKEELNELLSKYLTEVNFKDIQDFLNDKVESGTKISYILRGW